MDLSNYTNMRDICGEISNGNKHTTHKNNIKELGKENCQNLFHFAVSVKENQTEIIITYHEEKDQTVICRLYDPDETLVACQTMEAGKATIILEDPQLWSPADPVLYTLLIITETEQYYYQTGIYEQTIEDGRLFVNHIWYPVMGVRGCDTEATLQGEMAQASVRLQMIRMRQNGINAFCLEKGKTYPSWISEIAEEEGVLIIREGDLRGKPVPRWKDYYHIMEQVNDIYETLKVLLWDSEHQA